MSSKFYKDVTIALQQVSEEVAGSDVQKCGDGGDEGQLVSTVVELTGDCF